MDTYFARLEEIIKKHEQEIDHLNNERSALRQEEKNMSFEQFNREYQNLINHLENETRSLTEAQNTLESYYRNYDLSNSLINDLRSLRDELSSARDSQDEAEINEEISRKESELTSAISSLPLELADYLRNSFLETDTTLQSSSDLTADTPDVEQPDLENPNNENLPEEVVPVTRLEDNNLQAPQNTDLPETEVNNEQPPINEQPNLSLAAQSEYSAISSDIENLRKAQTENDQILEESIKRINDIFKEEREKYENDGPFDNETLDNLAEHYLGLKTSENEIYLEAKRNQESISRKLKRLENKQAQIIEIDNFAKDTNISYEESKEIFQTLKKRNVLSNILQQKDLGDIIHKSSRTKAEKETLKKALEEIKKEIVDYHKENNDINIKDAINVLYGMDDKVGKKVEARDVKIPEETSVAIYNNAKQLPAVIRKVNFKPNDNKKSVVPDGPKDMPLLPELAKDDLKLPAVAALIDNNDEKNNEKSLDKLIDKEDKPTEEEAEKIEPPKKVEQPKLKRGLREIIGTLRKDLEIGKKDGSRYRRSNLKVSQNFKKELQSGNTLYNIVHVVPATIKATTQLLGKISGKIMLGKEAKEMMKTLEERVDNLSYDDLETIFKEYRGNRVNQERYPQALNMVIEQKMSEYILGKVTKINENIEKCYQNVFYTDNLVKSLDENLRKGKLSSEEKLSRLEERKEALRKAAESIKYIREAKIEADNLLSGGLHGLSEDMKASASKLNCVGMRFAKTHDLDNDLEDALMKCEQRENKAIHDGNDEMLLQSFIESELLLSSNTEINYSIFGKRSTGKKYYSPLAEQLNYNNDPFIRDLFTTIAVTASAIGAVNASSNVKNHNNQVEQISASQQEMLDKIHKAGEDITSKRGAMYEGMKAQANQDVLTSTGTIERASLEANGWTLGTDAYHAADHAGHEFFNNFYTNVQNRFADVSKEYSSGVIDQSMALQELAKISNDSHATLVNVADKCLEILKPYAQNNPQFNLAATQDTMQFIIDHPSAIANMNQAMVDVQNIGDELLTLSETQMANISSLPGNLGPTFLSAASACALASNVSATMKNTHKNKYGNAVTDMVEEYINNYEFDDETKDNVR